MEGEIQNRELREMGVENPGAFPEHIRENIWRLGRCLKEERGKELLQRYRVKDWGWGMLDDDEVLLVIRVEKERFESEARERGGPVMAMIEVGAEFAEALEEAFPHLKDILFSVDAVPYRE